MKMNQSLNLSKIENSIKVILTTIFFLFNIGISFAQPISEWAPFFHGVASGEPSENSIILWTRVTPDSMMTGNIEVDWKIATDPELTNILFSGVTEAEQIKDYTVKIKVEGLASGGTYYYGFSALGKNSLTGRTKTTPAGADAEHLKFGVVNCANFQTGYFNAYQQLSKRNDLDAVIFLGDFFYEYGNGVVANPDILADRQIEPANEVVTLDDYRMRYSTYHLDTNIIRLLQQHPLIAVWDDHEFANNAWIGGATNHNPGEGEWEDRKAAASQAYFEWIPIENNPDNRIYRSLRYGDLMELIMLDTRITGREEPFASLLDPGIQNPDRTILGTEQKAWFFDKLLNSDAKWKVVGNQVVFSKFSMGWLTILSPTQTFYGYENLFLDNWKGFPAEQQQVLDYIEENEIDNIVIVSGDIHNAFAQDVPNTPNEFILVDTANLTQVPLYTPSDTYDSVTGEGSLAVEMVVQSVTSDNFDELFGAVVAAFVAPFINKDIVAAAGSINLGNPNPQLKYADLANHGYFILDVKPDSVQGNWYYTPILNPSQDQTFGQAWYTLDGENRLRQSMNDSEPKFNQDTPAPPNPSGLVNVEFLSKKTSPFTLLGLYPNPFNEYQVLHFGLNKHSEIEISLLNGNGQTVEILFSGNQPEGVYAVDLKNMDLATGNYFWRIQLGDFIQLIKAVKQ
jgi:alkaline phosphatase D